MNTMPAGQSENPIRAAMEPGQTPNGDIGAVDRSGEKERVPSPRTLIQDDIIRRSHEIQRYVESMRAHDRQREQFVKDELSRLAEQR